MITKPTILFMIVHGLLIWDRTSSSLGWLIFSRNKLLVDFMDVIGKKLGVDIKSAMKSEFTINTKTEE